MEIKDKRGGKIQGKEGRARGEDANQKSANEARRGSRKKKVAKKYTRAAKVGGYKTFIK